MNLKTGKLKRYIVLFLLAFPLFVFPQREKAFEINAKLGRGINYGNMLESPTETEWGNPWKPEYPGIIAGLGFNHVRIPIRWEPSARSMTTPPYTIYPSFLNRVKQVVDSTLSKGLYAVINMHHHDTLSLYPAAQKARFLAQWEQISDFFKDYPDSLLFEILNEPHGNMDAEIWNTFLVEALEKIRIKNPNRIVLIGTAEWGGVAGLSKLRLPGDQNIILTVHYYNPFTFTHQGASWSSGSDAWLGTKWQDSEQEREVMKQDFAPLLKLSQEKNIPVHIGEFGAYSTADLESRGKWTTFLARYFESLNWSWAYWEFSAGFGIYDPVAKTYLQPLINALLHNKMPEAAQFEATQVYKSNFQNGTDGWVMHRQGTAVAQISNSGAKLNIQITDGSTEYWHVQLVKNLVPLYKGKKYRVSFTAKAAEQRTIVSYAGKSVDPWSAYSNYDTFTITDSLKEYSYIFDMKSTDLTARIVFDLGKSVSGMAISEIKLEKLTLKTTSTARISNDLKIFPNPVQNSFRILNGEGFSSATLYNLFGEIVFSGEPNSRNIFDISELKPGLYVLKLTDGDKTVSRKILKQ